MLQWDELACRRKKVLQKARVSAMGFLLSELFRSVNYQDLEWESGRVREHEVDNNWKRWRMQEYNQAGWRNLWTWFGPLEPRMRDPGTWLESDRVRKLLSLVKMILKHEAWFLFVCGCSWNNVTNWLWQHWTDLCELLGPLGSPEQTSVSYRDL